MSTDDTSRLMFYFFLFCCVQQSFEFPVSSVGEIVLQQLLNYDEVETVQLTIHVKACINHFAVHTVILFLTARCTRPIVQNAILRLHVVRLSVCL